MSNTREEIYLNAISEGSTTDLKPITREELFLAKLAGQDITPPEPITRKEMFLQKIVDNGGSGGSTEPSDMEAQWIAAIERDANNPVTKLPDGLTKIGNYAFYECDNLVLSSLPDSLTSIGDSAFYKCDKLALTELPDSLTSIGKYAFQSCTKLRLTSLPDGIISISASAFYRGWNKESELEIPGSLETLDAMAFRSNLILTTVTFKGTPTMVSNNAFSECTNLLTINVPWAEGEVADAPWGATNATINYNYTGG